MASVKRGLFRNSRFNPNLIFGAALIIFIVLVSILVNDKKARVAAVEPNLPPSAQNIFGTDSQGRDVFTTLILAVPPTLRVGLVAGAISVFLGLALGLI